MTKKPLYIERFFLFLGYMMHHRLVRLLLCCFLLIYQWLPAVAQSPAKYKEIDDFIKGNQLKVTSPADIKVFGRELKRLFTDDEIKARAAFFWLTQHIKYDCEGYRSGQYTVEPEEVLSKGIAVCSGYASLMKMFCDELGVECEVVSGFATGISVDKVHLDSMKSNHAWNAVKIKGEWKLVDPTWGSGSANNDCTKTYPALNEQYFLSDPRFMIQSHLPEEEKWQLIPAPYSARQFADSANAMEYAAKWEEPRDSVIKRRVGDIIRFRLLKEDLRNFFSVMLYNKEDSLIEDLNVPVKLSTDGFYYCDYKVKRAGTYDICLSLYYYTGKETGFVGTSIVSYKLVANPAINKQP